MAELMEWPCLDEYEKLVIRMNTPRLVGFSLSLSFLLQSAFKFDVFFGTVRANLKERN